MGYFCNAVFGGSKGLNSGLSDNAYSNSPNELSKPAPNALISPSCLHKPNSTVNQKIVASFAISSSDAPNDAKPISCEKSAKSGSANYVHKRNKLDGDNKKGRYDHDTLPRERDPTIHDKHRVQGYRKV